MHSHSLIIKYQIISLTLCNVLNYCVYYLWYICITSDTMFHVYVLQNVYTVSEDETPIISRAGKKRPMECDDDFGYDI